MYTFTSIRNPFFCRNAAAISVSEWHFYRDFLFLLPMALKCLSVSHFLSIVGGGEDGANPTVHFRAQSRVHPGQGANSEQQFTLPFTPMGNSEYLVDLRSKEWQCSSSKYIPNNLLLLTLWCCNENTKMWIWHYYVLSCWKVINMNTRVAQKNTKLIWQGSFFL